MFSIFIFTLLFGATQAEHHGLHKHKQRSIMLQQYDSWTINLTWTDPTLTIAGGWAAKFYYVNITGCDGCEIELRIKCIQVPKDTDFSVEDALGTKIVGSSLLNSSFITKLTAPLKLYERDLNYGNYGNYAYLLAFRLIDVNDARSAEATKIFTFVPTKVSKPTTINYPTGSGPHGMFVLFGVAPKEQPLMLLYPTKPITPGCEYTLYSGGIPTPAAESRYFIYKYTSANSVQMIKSYIRSNAVTLWVPPNCSVSVDAQSFGSSTVDPPEVYMYENPRSGFAMSCGYPKHKAYCPELQRHFYEFDDTVIGYGNTSFKTWVKFHRGHSAPYLNLTFSDGTHLHFTTSGENTTTTRSDSIRIKFDSHKVAAYLLHFDTVIGDPKSGTTPTLFVLFLSFALIQFFY